MVALVECEQADGRTDGQTDGRMDVRWTNGLTDGRVGTMNRRTDGRSTDSRTGGQTN